MAKIVEPAELLGHMDTSDGRRIPRYKCKSETTLTNTVTLTFKLTATDKKRDQSWVYFSGKKMH